MDNLCTLLDTSGYTAHRYLEIESLLIRRLASN